jgi:hypothetical protein
VGTKEIVNQIPRRLLHGVSMNFNPEGLITSVEERAESGEVDNIEYLKYQETL